MTDKSVDGLNLVFPTEFLGNIKYCIQEELLEIHGSIVIPEFRRKDSFLSLLTILFANHLTLVSNNRQEAEATLMDDSIDILVEASVDYYMQRHGALSVSDYVTDILDIARSRGLLIALR